MADRLSIYNNDSQCQCPPAKDPLPPQEHTRSGTSWVYCLLTAEEAHTTHHGGTVGHPSKCYKGLIIGFGFVVGDFAENSEGFALDWIVTGSRGN